MDGKSNTFIETLKASLFLNFDEKCFQLEKEFDNYVPMWIWGSISLLFSSIIYVAPFFLFSISSFFGFIPFFIFLSNIVVLFGIFYFLLQNRLTYFKPLNLLKNLMYSYAIIAVYFIILLIIKLIWIFFLSTLNMYPGWNIFTDILISFMWLITFQTIWYTLVNIHINFKESKIRILLSQIFIIISTLGLFLLSFLVTNVFL